MKHVLEPLARLPGVRTAALVSTDGVPICVHGARRDNARGTEVGSGAGSDDERDIHALAGLATGWMGEISRAVAPLSWDAPRRLVLQAARGTLVIVQAPGALLLVVFEGGIQPGELRLPMDVAVQRLQRHMRSIDERAATAAPTSPPAPAGLRAIDQQPSGVFPRRSSPRPGASAPGAEPKAVGATGNGGPEVPHVIGD